MVGSGTNQSKDFTGRRNSKLQAAARRALGGTETSTTSRAEKMHPPEGVQLQDHGHSRGGASPAGPHPCAIIEAQVGGSDHIAAPGAGRRSPRRGLQEGGQAGARSSAIGQEGEGRRSLRGRGNAPRLTGAKRRQPLGAGPEPL
jgi:hypothetical protein